MKVKAPVLLAASAVALFVTAAPASAEIVFLSSGRTLSVKDHRIDGDSIVLTLRSGGQVTCAKDLIEKIEADEVPTLNQPRSNRRRRPIRPIRRATDCSTARRTPISSRHCRRRTGSTRCSSAP